MEAVVLGSSVAALAMESMPRPATSVHTSTRAPPLRKVAIADRRAAWLMSPWRATAMMLSLLLLLLLLSLLLLLLLSLLLLSLLLLLLSLLLLP